MEADTNASASKVKNVSQEKLLFASSCSKSSNVFIAKKSSKRKAAEKTADALTDHIEIKKKMLI